MSLAKLARISTKNPDVDRALDPIRNALNALIASQSSVVLGATASGADTGASGGLASIGPWGVQNVAANTTASPTVGIIRHLGDYAGTGGFNTIIIPAFKGSVVGLSARISATITAGYVEVSVWKGSNGLTATNTGFSHRLSVGDVDGYTISPAGQFRFEAGDTLMLRYSSPASLLPAGSAELLAWMNFGPYEAA